MCNILLYPTTWYQVYSTRYIYICRGVLAVAPDADHPTQTLTLTLARTLWGDLCLDAVACEGSIVGDIFSLHDTSVGCVWLTYQPRCGFNFSAGHFVFPYFLFPSFFFSFIALFFRLFSLG